MNQEVICYTPWGEMVVNFNSFITVITSSKFVDPLSVSSVASLPTLNVLKVFMI